MDVFAGDVQKAQAWLKELTIIGNFRDETQAYSVLRIVIHALRDRLTANAAVHLGSQLPLIICGMYYTGWDPDKTPTNERTMNDFLEKIFPKLSKLEVDNKKAVIAVCQLLEEKLDQGQIQNISDVLPGELKQLFSKNIEV